jgi:hypothetical protein
VRVQAAEIPFFRSLLGQFGRDSSVAAAKEIWNARAPTSGRGFPGRLAFDQGGGLLFREPASLSGCSHQAWPLGELAGLRMQGERPESDCELERSYRVFLHVAKMFRKMSWMKPNRIDAPSAWVRIWDSLRFENHPRIFVWGLFQQPGEGPVLLLSRSWTNSGNPLHIEARRRKGPGGPTGLQNRPGSYCGCRRVRLPPPSAFKQARAAKLLSSLMRSGGCKLQGGD